MSQRSVKLGMVIAALFLLYYRFPIGRRVAQWRESYGADKHVPRANSTLGFGAVVAVSQPNSSRRAGLILAANLTDIDIIIPSQPLWTDVDLEGIRAQRDSRISRGSALAWLGHLNALRWFLNSDLETVMILEDDVDWDIRLRTIQIPAAAAAIRQLLRTSTNSINSLTFRVQRDSFWGDPGAWDILYLGHCGDIFNPDSWSFHVPRLLYEDVTVPWRKNMHPSTQEFLESIGIPEKTRVIHQSIFPLCTFGFALTRNAAWKLLNEIAVRESDGGTMAYDVRVLEACRDFGFRCWSANPELFHHMDAESEIERANTGESESADSYYSTEATESLSPVRTGKAPNIACGVRSSNLTLEAHSSIDLLWEMMANRHKCFEDSAEDTVSSSPS